MSSEKVEGTTFVVPERPDSASRNRDEHPATQALRVVRRHGREHESVVVRIRRPLHHSGRERREARPRGGSVVLELDREPQGVAACETLVLVVERRDVGARAELLPAEGHATRDDLARERDPVGRDAAGRGPGERQRAARPAHAFGVRPVSRVFVGRVVGRVREDPFFFRRSPAREDLVRGDAERVHRTAPDTSLHGSDDAVVDPQDLARTEAEQEQRVPVDDRHGDAIAHDVHRGIRRLPDERSVAEHGRAAEVVGFHVVAEFLFREEIVVRRGLDPPALQHVLPVERRKRPPGLPSVVVEQEPGRRAVVHALQRVRPADVVSGRVAVELARRDHHDIREVEVLLPEHLFREDVAPRPLLQQVDGGVVRRLHQAAVRVPLGRGEPRLVHVTVRDRTDHVARRERRLHALGQVLTVEREPFERLAERGVPVGEAVVTPDVHMVAARGAGRALEPDQHAGDDVLHVVHEHLRQVADHEVGAVVQIDVDVHAEPGIRILVVHVRRPVRGREHDVRPIVRGVEICVVERGREVVRVGAARPLRAAGLVPGLERQIDGDAVLAATDLVVLVARLVGRTGRERLLPPARRTAREGERTEQEQDDLELLEQILEHDSPSGRGPNV